MKKTLCILGICGATVLSGCGAQNTADQGRNLYNETGHTLNINNNRPELFNREQGNASENFGYVRLQRKPTINENNADHYAFINREQMAHIIGQYCTEVPNVDDVSTLVTDDKVLIVYDTDSQDRNQTADQVKRMAMSVVPRWYHVYVSDNTNLRQNVANFAPLGSNSRHVDIYVNDIVKEMLKSPQGYRVSEGENENGEAEGELNDGMDQDDIGKNMRNSRQFQENDTRSETMNRGSEARNRTGNQTGIQDNLDGIRR